MRARPCLWVTPEVNATPRPVCLHSGGYRRAIRVCDDGAVASGRCQRRVASLSTFRLNAPSPRQPRQGHPRHTLVGACPMPPGDARGGCHGVVPSTRRRVMLDSPLKRRDRWLWTLPETRRVVVHAPRHHHGSRDDATRGTPLWERAPCLRVTPEAGCHGIVASTWRRVMLNGP